MINHPIGYHHFSTWIIFQGTFDFLFFSFQGGVHISYVVFWNLVQGKTLQNHLHLKRKIIWTIHLHDFGFKVWIFQAYIIGDVGWWFGILGLPLHHQLADRSSWKKNNDGMYSMFNQLQWHYRNTCWILFDVCSMHFHKRFFFFSADHSPWHIAFQQWSQLWDYETAATNPPQWCGMLEKTCGT